MDVEGSLWDVRLIRDTKHGFDLLFGSPARPGRLPGRPAAPDRDAAARRFLGSPSDEAARPVRFTGRANNAEARAQPVGL